MARQGETGGGVSTSPPVATVGPNLWDAEPAATSGDQHPGPDIFRSWRVFARALGVHVPASINRARATSARVRRIAG